MPHSGTGKARAQALAGLTAVLGQLTEREKAAAERAFHLGLGAWHEAAKVGDTNPPRDWWTEDRTFRDWAKKVMRHCTSLIASAIEAGENREAAITRVSHDFFASYDDAYCKNLPKSVGMSLRGLGPKGEHGVVCTAGIAAIPSMLEPVARVVKRHVKGDERERATLTLQLARWLITEHFHVESLYEAHERMRSRQFPDPKVLKKLRSLARTPR